MASEPLDSMLIGVPNVHTLKMFVRFLNARDRIAPHFNGKGGRRPDQLEVHRLVKAWFKCGHNVSMLLASEPVLAHESRNIRVCLVPGTRARLAIIDIGTRDLRFTDPYPVSGD
jgi:hypothetical protein